MPRNEYELIDHSFLPDIKLFLVELAFRNLHMHSEFELCQVMGGQVEVLAQRTTNLFSQGDLFLFNPKQPHEIRAAAHQPAMILSLQVSPRFCARYFPLIRNLEFDAINISSLISPEQSGQLKRQLLQLCEVYFQGSQHYELPAYALINQIFYQLVVQVPWHDLSDSERTAKASTADRLGRIMDYTESHFTDKVLLADIAKQEDLSLSYLSHYFKNNLNMTFQDYIALLRFEEARSLLERTDMNMTDVAIASGFSDSRYLIKAFRKHLGCTPTEYRSQLNHSENIPAARPGGSVQRILSRDESLTCLLG